MEKEVIELAKELYVAAQNEGPYVSPHREKLAKDCIMSAQLFFQTVEKVRKP